jgi:anti-sigma-K factor RskA
MTSANHDELSAQLGAYVLGVLTPPEHEDVQAHVAGCAACAGEVRLLGATADAVAWSVMPVDPPVAVRQRVMSSIHASPAPSRVPVKRSLVPWFAAAACFLFAMALGAYAARLRGRVQALEQALESAVLQVQGAEQQTAQARLVAADAQQELSVLAAPDVAHLDLKGQAAASRASARILWSRSRGLLLAASNLPLLPPGRTYQLWVLSGRTAPISDAWVFTTDVAGNVTILFKTSSTLPTPTAMAVTIEPDGGRAAPTGAMYLTGSFN